MPTNEALQTAVLEAVKVTNEGFQNTSASPAILPSDGTVTERSALLRGTLLKGVSGGHVFYWWVPTGTYEVVAQIGSTSKYKLMIVKTGNATATGGGWCKPDELAEVTHGIRGVLTTDDGAGENAALTVAGLPATLAPETSGPLTHLTMKVGGARWNAGGLITL